jgi:hypothetical protein
MNIIFGAVLLIVALFFAYREMAKDKVSLNTAIGILVLGAILYSIGSTIEGNWKYYGAVLAAVLLTGNMKVILPYIVAGVGYAIGDCLGGSSWAIYGAILGVLVGIKIAVGAHEQEDR